MECKVERQSVGLDSRAKDKCKRLNPLQSYMGLCPFKSMNSFNSALDSSQGDFAECETG